MKEIIKQHDTRFEDIFVRTVEDMKAIGTYKQEFSPAITRYAEMRLQFEILIQQWYKGGCKITEKYTNKAGAVYIIVWRVKETERLKIIMILKILFIR